MDITDVADVTDITDVAGVMDVTDITGGTVRHMASWVRIEISFTDVFWYGNEASPWLTSC